MGIPEGRGGLPLALSLRLKECIVMAGEITVTVIGNLTTDPDYKQLTSGHVVANLTVAQNSRVYDRASGEWRDGATAFMRCVVWNEMADHVAASLFKGARVIVTGRLRQRNYQDRNDVTQWITEVMVDDIAASLRFTTVAVSVDDPEDAAPVELDEDPHATTPVAKKAPAKQQAARRGKPALVGAGVGDQPDF
ncbi:single-stranded DNA-binding protein [Nocardia seriolae]|nr:single-stranded DNA-binding protein [Nocardia seriolae]MTJ61711.1 single-stranded DNA-binding protein [Nocardia seriolae]MTJ75911.1 single-stranded DNA-binding protein [Nocardia seriolae]MTJ86720.1 single-stranded DNA-binding protein [Nocardia seriolae]MTK30716.1 single-stranded DNA-binding protein [Nocardia seriolae]MTK39679.1 single-stranded DNA-binding protein [Nocardia seriolae]